MKKLLAGLLVFALLVTTVWTLASVIGSGSGDDPASGSASGEPTPGEPPTSEAGARTPPDEALEPFYSQSLDWESCEGSHQCAELTVPLDYAEPDGESIELALLKVPASGDRIGSLVVNPGGPGAPGTDYAGRASQVFRQPLLRAYDIVGFDPRGTGDSAPIDCLSDERLDAVRAFDPDPDNPAETEQLGQLLREFGEGCVERSGDLVNHVSTIEVARDMDVLRAVLGEGQLDYFGASYGTKIGATYAELFPERVGRLVLDGAVDVSLDNRELSIEQAAGFETALRAYVQDCIDTTATCFLGDSVEEGLATITELLADIEEQPLPTSDERQLEVGSAFYGLVTPLYVREAWYLLSTALRAALNGQGEPLMQLADIYASRGPDGYTDNSAEAIFAINCLDDPSYIEFDEVDEELPAFEEASPTFGSIFAWSLTNCGASEGRSSEEPITIRGEGAAPILVVGTTRDPATPMKWAVALADQLESAVLLRRDGDGHTAYNSGNECIDTAIESYLIDGDVPEDETTC